MKPTTGVADCNYSDSFGGFRQLKPSYVRIPETLAFADHDADHGSFLLPLRPVRINGLAARRKDNQNKDQGQPPKASLADV